MTPRLCTCCRERTYPERWCGCDPRAQIAAYLAESLDVLMEGEMDDFEILPMTAECLLRRRAGPSGSPT